MCLPIRPQRAVRAYLARTRNTAIMTSEDEIKQALDSISPEAVAWSHGRNASTLIDGARHLEGEELVENMRSIAQMAYDEGRLSR